MKLATLTNNRKPVLLIVGRHEDPHILQILPLLKDRHLRVLRFNPSDFPADASLSLKLGSSQQMTAILSFPSCEIDGEIIETVEIDIREIDLVWNRVRSRSQAPAEVNKCHRLWVEENCTRQLAYLYELIRCPWIPYRPDSCHAQFTREAATPVSVLSGQRYAEGDRGPSPENKIYQLLLAQQLGFSIPETLLTSRPQDLLDFYSECRGNLISKKLVDLVMSLDGVPLTPFTHAVTEHDLMRYEAVRMSPVLFQERLDKKLELRVTVVGNKVFAAEIYSANDPKQSIDWRRYPSFNLARFYAPHELPLEEEQRCIRLVQELGQCFGAIDLVLHPERGYVFLEINPNGQWGWIEDFTGLPIAAAFADLLVRLSSNHSSTREQVA
tara:strand:- start:1195 stop:2343 length:1149 start_codon:yes stop_codon:yes gene_type:complete